MQVNAAIDLVLLIVFTVELALKLVGLGIGGYFENNWNRLDAFVVVMGYVTMAPGMDQLVVMRLLRVFRPLRIINKLEGMKAIVKTLAMSAAGLRDTCILCIFIFFLFGIVGDTLFGGVLRQKCFTETTVNNMTTYEEDDSIERLCGGEFKCPQTHKCMHSGGSPNFSITSFDYIAAGFLTIFVAITLEGWVDVMYLIQDGYSFWVSTIYFHLLVIVGSLFAVNLALAVISDCFDQTLVPDEEELDDEEIAEQFEQEAEDGVVGTAAPPQSMISIVRRQKKRAAIARIQRRERDERKNMKGKMIASINGVCKAYLGTVARNLYFQNFILAVILANTIILGMEHAPDDTVAITGSDGVVYLQDRAGEMSDGMKLFLEVSNGVFVSIFTIEMVIKILGMGFEAYWQDRFNRFDAFVVVMSYVEILASSSGSFTALRAFRLMRIFKVARRWKAMQTIMRCILETLPSMGYLCILLLLFMFIMAVAGMFLFGDKMKPPKLDEVPRNNYDHFAWAMLTVFVILSGENWNEVLYNGIHVTSPIAVIYFLILVCIGTFIVLNLTLAILLSNFDEGDYGEDDMYSPAELLQGALEYLPESMRCKSTAVVAPSEAAVDDESSTGETAGKYEISEDSSSTAPGVGKGSGAGNSGQDMTSQQSGGSVITSAEENFILESEKKPPKKMKNEEKQNAEEEKALERALDHVKGKMCGAMMGGIKDMKKNADLAHYLHQWHINCKYSNPDLEASVLHSSMAVALQQHNEAEASKKQTEDAMKDCTGFIPGEPPELIDNSLFCFVPTNPVRMSLSHVVVHPVFDNFILFLIIASTITLAMDGPTLDPDSDLAAVLKNLDYVFTTIFTIELFMKVIVYGLIMSETAYLRDSWNVLDAFIVTISLLSVFAGDAAGSIRSLRTLRALRPLRTIKRAPGLRCVVEAIVRCVPPFVNIALVSTVFYLIFAIMGVQFWAGKFWSCNDGDVSHADQCVGQYVVDGTNATRVWSKAVIHFDNVQQGMLSLFEVASLELWLDAMYSAMDSPIKIHEAPERNRAPFYALYFVVFVVIGAFLILNLFVGAVVDTFTTVKNEQNRVATMTPAQAEFVSSMRSMMRKRPFAALLPPELGTSMYGFRKFCYEIVQFDFKGKKTGMVFDSTVISLICLNVIAMSLIIWEKPPDGTEVGTIEVVEAQESEWNKSLSYVNLVFTFCFVLEAVLKVIGLGHKQYFGSAMNCFDFFVVGISVVGDILERSVEGYDVSFANVLLIFRAARVMRIFRLFTRFKGVKRLLETLLYTLPSLLNVTTLLVMVLFIYTILGMSFFGGTTPMCPEGPCPYGLYNEHANFKYFHIGFITLFRMSTGESWNGIMHDCAAVHGGGASFFFVSYMVIGSSLMFNLVIAILLDEFSSMGASDSYEVTPEAIGKFAEKWQELDPSGSQEIPCKKLVLLLQRVDPPLGVGPTGTAAEAHVMLLKVNAPLNSGQAHFVETFVALVRYAYKVTAVSSFSPCASLVRSLFLTGS